MKIIVRAKPNSKKEMIERIGQPVLDLGGLRPPIIEYKICVKEPPIKGKANEAIVKILAKYFGVTPSLIRLVSGVSSKRKVFEIRD